jgi:hypothetical protein
MNKRLEPGERFRTWNGDFWAYAARPLLGGKLTVRLGMQILQSRLVFGRYLIIRSHP